MSGLAQLLADCNARGIRLLPADDGGLTIDAPQAVMTAEIMGRLKAHKGELLTRLRPASAPPKPACDSTKLSAKKGLQEKCDARAQLPNTSESSAAVCRCGATNWRDVPIHGGHSIRRDCGRCGRFIDFPVWYGKSALLFDK